MDRRRIRRPKQTRKIGGEMEKITVQVFFYIFITFAFGDLIHLKDGTKVERKVIKETPEEVIIKIIHGSITMKTSFQKDQIKEIQLGKTDKERVIDALNQIGSLSQNELFDLVRFCEKKGFLHLAKKFNKQIKSNEHKQWKKNNTNRDGKGQIKIQCIKFLKSECDKCNGKGRYIHKYIKKQETLL